MASMKEPTFKINPKFRLTTQYLSVKWHLIDKETMQCEASIVMPDRYVLAGKNGVEILVQYHDGIMDMIYHPSTDFESNRIQKWLRELFRDTILRIAKDVLPERVRYWEKSKVFMEAELQSNVCVKAFSVNAHSKIISLFNRFSLYLSRSGWMGSSCMRWHTINISITGNHFGTISQLYWEKTLKWLK